jgi:hypothetical protein
MHDRFETDVRPRLIPYAVAALAFGFLMELVLRELDGGGFNPLRAVGVGFMWWILTLGSFAIFKPTRR